MKRLLLLILLLFVAATAFEFVYRYELRVLKEEAQKVEPQKKGRDLTVHLFRELEKVWTLKGSAVDLSDPGRVEFVDFYGKNYDQLFEVSARRALYLVKEGKIFLSGSVVFRKFLPNGEVAEELRTEEAVVDLVQNKVFGRQKVILKKGGVLLVGYGFLYDPKVGRFIILRDVQTYFDTP
ncbi:MAG: LPS export ABC transporter periplasmic protein LptC [Aquificae bacterium]|nr:LPS export ABC transporter periplasmic protein LptC [Aquificota bacterium]